MKSLFLTLTPAKMRQKLLDEAQHDLVETAKNREYYVAMEAMLKQRIERLRDEIHEDNSLRAPALASIPPMPAHLKSAKETS